MIFVRFHEYPSTGSKVTGGEEHTHGHNDTITYPSLRYKFDRVRSLQHWMISELRRTSVALWRQQYETTPDDRKARYIGKRKTASLQHDSWAVSGVYKWASSKLHSSCSVYTMYLKQNSTGIKTPRHTSIRHFAYCTRFPLTSPTLMQTLYLCDRPIFAKRSSGYQHTSA